MGAYFFLLGIYIAAAVGWVMNIVLFIQGIGVEATWFLALRLFGFLAFPLGGVLGYIS